MSDLASQSYFLIYFFLSSTSRSFSEILVKSHHVITEIPIIETDAPIDKGNSGGGLFDSDGNLIGICSACEIVGGARECFDDQNQLTMMPDDPYQQCEFHCNKTQPQNWFIPISRFEELLDD